MFSIPGSAADTEIPYEEWKNTYHMHHQQQGHVASGSAESSGLAQEAAEGHVLEAWGSNEPCQQEGRVETCQQEGRGQQSAKNEDVQSKKDSIKNEW